jgi:outer membrane protein assembly factor BamE
MRLAPTGAVLLAAVTLAGCAASADPERRFAGLITPYRMEVVQGNVVTQEMAAQLRPGLTRDQVRGLLGSPLLADIFHADRWDYVFTLKRNGVEVQRRTLVVWFEGDVIKSVEAPELPSEREFVASISPARDRNAVTRPLELTPQERAALPRPATSASASRSTEPLGAVRSYPPLESL